jgi:hypothetical protein
MALGIGLKQQTRGRAGKPKNPRQGLDKPSKNPIRKFRLPVSNFNTGVSIFNTGVYTEGKALPKERVFISKTQEICPGCLEIDG